MLLLYCYRNYKNVFDALARCAREEGPRALYAGINNYSKYLAVQLCSMHIRYSCYEGVLH
jgi:hypothetical protein